MGGDGKDCFRIFKRLADAHTFHPRPRSWPLYSRVRSMTTKQVSSISKRSCMLWRRRRRICSMGLPVFKSGVLLDTHVLDEHAGDGFAYRQL